jgi:hypothetical protein
MSMRVAFLALLFPLVLLRATGVVAETATAQAQAAGKALVLDGEPRIVARVDLASGTILERLQLEGLQPAGMLLSPTRTRLVVIHKMDASWTLRLDRNRCIRSLWISSGILRFVPRD